MFTILLAAAVLGTTATTEPPTMTTPTNATSTVVRTMCYWLPQVQIMNCPIPVPTQTAMLCIDGSHTLQDADKHPERCWPVKKHGHMHTFFSLHVPTAPGGNSGLLFRDFYTWGDCNQAAIVAYRLSKKIGFCPPHDKWVGGSNGN